MNASQKTDQAPPVAIVIFGASGDLTQRKLVPALHSLACDDLLSPATRVVGVGRTEFTDEAFRQRLREGVEEYARLKPDEGIRLRLQAKEPGAGMVTRPINIDYAYAQDFDQRALPEAYERLLLDAVQGDASLFARADEIVRAWDIIDPVLEEWEDADPPPDFIYEPGSWGPERAEAFLAQDDRHWHYGCSEWET